MILVILAGGLGAVARFILDTIISTARPGRLPLGTSIINATGSLLLGFATGWWTFHTGDPGLRRIIGTGFLGGYTTFSAACVEAARLALGDRPGPALGRMAGVLVVSVAAAFAGYWLAAVVG
ncbi:MAG: fluoride efflux transporter FluC [Arachnia sp.]